MKSSQLCLYMAASFLTFSVSCQSFGQSEVASVSKESEAKVEFQNKADHKSLLIDFTKTPLKSVKNPSIKSELRMGPGSGGGGNTCAFMLKLQTLELLDQMKFYPPFQQDGVAEILEKNINAAQFHSTDKDLFINGKDVEAINYPFSKVVVVEQAFCDKMAEITSASLGTLLHEYLGLAGFDDTEFQISGDFVQSLNQFSGLNKVGVAGFASVHINRLRAKFHNSNSKFILSAPISKSLQCSLFREVDGVPTSEHFSLISISDQSVIIQFSLRGGMVLERYATMSGIRAGLVADDENSTTILNFRQDSQGSLIGEWAIVGRTPQATLKLQKSTYPVPSLSTRGTLATGYSICAPQK